MTSSRSRGPAARARGHHDLPRQPHVRARRPALRAVLDPGRRDHRRARGLAARRIARCSPATCWVRSSATSRTCTRCAATRSAARWRTSTRSTACIGARARDTDHRPRRVPRRATRSGDRLTQVRDATRLPPRPHHRRDELGRRPLDAMRTVTLPPELDMPRATARCRGSSARSGRSTPAGSATNRPPSSTTFRRPRSGRTLVELAGGTASLPSAPAHLEAGRPLHALHFTDIGARPGPDDPDALEVKRVAPRAAAGRERTRELQRGSVA